MPLDYSAALGNFGVKYTIKWRGQERPVQFLTDASRQAFEQWAKRQELAALRQGRDEGLSTEAEYQSDRRAVLTEVHKGLWGFWSPNVLRWLAGEDYGGLNQLLLILLKEADPAFRDEDLPALAAEEPEQVEDVLDLILAEVMARAKAKKLLPADYQPPGKRTTSRTSAGTTPPPSKAPTTEAEAYPMPTTRK